MENLYQFDTEDNSTEYKKTKQLQQSNKRKYVSTKGVKLSLVWLLHITIASAFWTFLQYCGIGGALPCFLVYSIAFWIISAHSKHTKSKVDAKYVPKQVSLILDEIETKSKFNFTSARDSIIDWTKKYFFSDEHPNFNDLTTFSYDLLFQYISYRFNSLTKKSVISDDELFYFYQVARCTIEWQIKNDIIDEEKGISLLNNFSDSFN